MARTVAALSVSINARTRGLRRGLKQARKELSTFANGIKRTVQVSAAVAATAAGAVTFGVAQQIASLSNLAKTARKLSNIDPNALIALRDLAQQSGVEVKTLDMGLQRMLRRIQEASQGKGEAKSTLEELGLDAKALIKLKPEEQFIKVAQAIKKAGADGRTLSRVFKLFDSEGVGLVNTFDNITKDGLKPFLDEIERTGRTVTEKMLKPVESVEDRFFRLGQRVRGIFQQLAIAVSGPLDKLLEKFERFLNAGGTQNAIRDTIRDIRIELGTADEKIKAFLKTWDALGDSINRAIESVKAFARDAAIMAKALGESVGEGAGALVMGPNPGNAPSFTNPLTGKAEQSMPFHAPRFGFTGRKAGTMNPATGGAVDRMLERLKSLGSSIVSLLDSTEAGVQSLADATRDSLNQATGASGGRVMRLERNGQPIPFGPKLGSDPTQAELLNEAKKQTNQLMKLNEKEVPGKGKFFIEIAG